MRAMFLLLALCLGSAEAQDGWIDPSGKPVPETPDRRSVDGFGGHLLVTADKDWQEKWNTPPETTPSFSTVDSVGPGGEVQILIFFSNPRRGAGDVVRLRCDLQVVRPDGSYSANERDLPCFDHAVPGPLNRVFMTDVSLKFIAEPGDPPGRWTVRVTLRDVLRDSEVALESGFELKAP
jgi:hypothetical protein